MRRSDEGKTISVTIHRGHVLPFVAVIGAFLLGGLAVLGWMMRGFAEAMDRMWGW